jgi:hypothetical protein
MVQAVRDRLPAALDGDGGLKTHIQNFPATVAVTQSTSPWVTQETRLPTALGQTTMSASLPVAIASDQPALAEAATAVPSTGALPALVKVIGAYDPDAAVVRSLSVENFKGQYRLAVFDQKTRNAVNDQTLLLMEIRDLLQKEH